MAKFIIACILFALACGLPLNNLQTKTTAKALAEESQAAPVSLVEKSQDTRSSKDGIDREALAAALAHDALGLPKKKRQPRAPKYEYFDKDGEKKTWTGQGHMPDAIKDKLDDGKSLDDFRIPGLLVEEESKVEECADAIGRIVNGEQCPASASTCVVWARQGYCEKDPDYMKVCCRKSCKFCQEEVILDETSITMEGDYDEVVGNNKDKFIEEFNAEYEASNVKCADVRPGSIILDLEGSSDALTEVTTAIEENGIKLPSFELITECADAIGRIVNGEQCPASASSCVVWARQGECEKDPDYMKVCCPKSCKFCQGTLLEEKMFLAEEAQ